MRLLFFVFNDTATTEIYTLSLRDALPIYRSRRLTAFVGEWRAEWSKRLSTDVAVRHDSFSAFADATTLRALALLDRKSTRLNSSHANISYAVFCLNKNKHNTARYECTHRC